MADTQQSQSQDGSLGRDLLYALRYYLGSRRGLLVLAGLAIAMGLALNWSWLAAAGIAPQSIDTIIATHLHPDHILALVNDGKAVFANAALVLSSADLNFWTNDANAAKAPDFAKPWFGGAKVSTH